MPWVHGQTVILCAWGKESSYTPRIIVAYNSILGLMLIHHHVFNLIVNYLTFAKSARQYSHNRDTPLCWFGKEQEPRIERTSPDRTIQNKVNLPGMHLMCSDYQSEMSMDSVSCSSWNSTVKARQAVGNDLAIQWVKRGHCCDECCECTLGRHCGKGQQSWRCVKWDCSNCISRDWFCREMRKHDYCFVI